MKPTTITVNTHRYESGEYVCKTETAVLTSFEGHDVYVPESAITGTRYVFQDGTFGDVNHNANIYRENGERIMCAWTYGRTGKSLRWACVVINAATNKISNVKTGMNGATGHGRGATLRFIDWDGSKYAEALETAKRTGKKLLHAF